MNRIIWHVIGRFYEVRAQRAYSRYAAFREKAEIFFRRIGDLD